MSASGGISAYSVNVLLRGVSGWLKRLSKVPPSVKKLVGPGMSPDLRSLVRASVDEGSQKGRDLGFIPRDPGFRACSQGESLEGLGGTHRSSAPTDVSFPHRGA